MRYILAMPEPIYLDHAATTPIRPEVREAMEPYFGPRFGNPSSMHRWGREARVALDEARERVAACVGARTDEICFTSGGTEADNLAVLGAWRARRAEGRNAVLTTPIEHKAVLAAMHQAGREGAEERLCEMTTECVVETSSFDQLPTARSPCVRDVGEQRSGTVQPIRRPPRRARAACSSHRRGVGIRKDRDQSWRGA
jgi:cysteine desulfurase